MSTRICKDCYATPDGIELCPEHEITADDERKRCVDIVNAARSGLIDSDLRAIRSWIEGGKPAPVE